MSELDVKKEDLYMQSANASLFGPGDAKPEPRASLEELL